jgi:hypothetical protein
MALTCAGLTSGGNWSDSVLTFCRVSLTLRAAHWQVLPSGW